MPILFYFLKKKDPKKTFMAKSKSFGDHHAFGLTLLQKSWHEKEKSRAFGDLELPVWFNVLLPSNEKVAIGLGARTVTFQTLPIDQICPLPSQGRPLWQKSLFDAN
jgi:hypothetical protein